MGFVEVSSEFYDPLPETTEAHLDVNVDESMIAPGGEIHGLCGQNSALPVSVTDAVTNIVEQTDFTTDCYLLFDASWAEPLKDVPTMNDVSQNIVKEHDTIAKMWCFSNGTEITLDDLPDAALSIFLEAWALVFGMNADAYCDLDWRLPENIDSVLSSNDLIILENTALCNKVELEGSSEKTKNFVDTIQIIGMSDTVIIG